MPIVTLGEMRAALPKGGRLLGLDLGSKTIGMAVSDASLTVASPIGAIRRRKFTLDAVELLAAIEERGVRGLVLGLPINMDGGIPGPVHQYVHRISRILPALRSPESRHMHDLQPFEVGA